MVQGSLFAIGAIVVRALFWLAATALVFVPLEALAPLSRRGERNRHLRTCLSWFFLNSLITLPVIGVLAGTVGGLIHAVAPAGIFGSVAGLSLWLRIPLAMVVGELGFYWGHRWSHEWNWLWRFHTIHHGPGYLYFLVNTTIHPVDMIFTRMCGAVLLVVSGLAASPLATGGDMVLPIVLFVGSGWSYFVHADVAARLGPLEGLIASPAFHHWHHDYSDNHGHNYAAMLPVLDMVFGTYKRPASWPERYGVTVDLRAGFADQLAYPFERPQ